MTLSNTEVQPYKPFLSEAAFNPRSPMFGKFHFDEPPAPPKTPTAEEVKALQEKLATTSAQLEELKKSTGAAGDYKADMLKYKDKATQLETQLAEMNQKAKTEQDRILAEQGNFKALYEGEKKAREVAEASVSSFKTGLVERDKRDAVIKEAVAQGLKADMMDILNLLPLEGVAAEFGVNEATKAVKVTIMGAKEFVEGLKKTRPSLFGTPGTPGVASTTPASMGTQDGEQFKISPADLVKMEKEKPEQYKEIMSKVYKGQIRLVTT